MIISISFPFLNSFITQTIFGITSQALFIKILSQTFTHKFDTSS